MSYCDRNQDIVEWASEEMFVPYVSPIDKKIHRYFYDFLVKTSSGKKVMIEIKKSVIQCKLLLNLVLVKLKDIFKSN